jgi:hypothetical protein
MERKGRENFLPNVNGRRNIEVEWFISLLTAFLLFSFPIISFSSCFPPSFYLLFSPFFFDGHFFFLFKGMFSSKGRK